MKPSPIDHLPRRALFADAPVTPPQAVPVTPRPVTPVTPRPVTRVTLDSSKPVKLAVARTALADIGNPPIEPPPLVDTTRPRSNAERQAAYRARKAAQTAAGALIRWPAFPHAAAPRRQPASR